METRTGLLNWLTDNSIAVLAVLVGVVAAAATGVTMGLPAWFVVGAGLALAAVVTLLFRGMARPTAV